MGVLVDGDIHLCHGTLLVVGYEMHLIVAAHSLEAALISCLVDVDEGLRIHRHLLGLGRVAHVHLVGLLHISPLRLAVIPYDGLWCARIKLVTLDGDGTACRAVLRTRQFEVGGSALLVADNGSGLVEHLLGGLRHSAQAHHRCESDS